MPETKKFGGKNFKRMRSFKKKKDAQDYADNCRVRGFNDRVEEQSGPRVMNKYVVYARRA